MKVRNMLAAGALALASLAATAIPALASVPHASVSLTAVHTEFTVVDGNGVLYTRQFLTPGQIIHHGTTWFTVRSVRPYGGYWIITMTPQAPAGARVQFWT